MRKWPVLWVALGLAFALGCRRKSEDPVPAAPRETPMAAAPPSSLDAGTPEAEPPPTEAEQLPEVRAAIAQAERGGVHLRFWRVAAGTPRPDGWVSATPTRGGFEIDLPIRFNDFSQTTQATDGVTIEIDGVGGPWEGGKVSCLRARRLDGSPSPVAARSMRDEWQARPETLSVRDRTWEGFPAVEVESKSTKTHAQMLIVNTGPGGNFNVTAELPEAAWTAHRAEVDRLVHSLKTNLAPPAGR